MKTLRTNALLGIEDNELPQNPKFGFMLLALFVVGDFLEWSREGNPGSLLALPHIAAKAIPLFKGPPVATLKPVPICR